MIVRLKDSNGKVQKNKMNLRKIHPAGSLYSGNQQIKLPFYLSVSGFPI